MQRHERLEEDVKLAISDIISREVKHPDVKGIISITKVHITPDNKYAKIYVSIFNVDDKSKVLNAIKKSNGFIKFELSKRVQMKYMPALEFVLDDSMDYGSHMDKIINSLQDEENSKK